MPSPTRILFLVSCGLAAGIAFRAAAAADPPPYTAAFADGTRVNAPQIAGWHDAAALPSVDGRPLFDDANPARWVIGGPPPVAVPGDRAPLPPGEEPAAFVEFVGGDRLPGIVEEHRSGLENWSERLPPHLFVRPATVVDQPGKPLREGVRVASDRLRRVVWSRGNGNPPAPATIRLRDGRDIAYRSIRWSGRSVLVLLEQETRRIPFEEIAEISLPVRNPWDAWYHTVAMLAPDRTARLFRVETADGLIATTSRERFRATGAANAPATWHHAVQPAWSLDLLWLPHPAIRRRVFTATHEMPLAMLEPSRVEREATFGGSWTCRVDRNVQGSPLVANGLPFGTGYGVQARCELFFPLPEIVTAFRTSVALDAAAQAGGCVKAAVRAGPPAAGALWESGFLVGSRDVADTGSLPLAAPAGGQSSLVLVADAAHDGRPTGADPHDIRDMVDWLDPVLSLDPARLAPLVAARLPATVPAWRDWQFEAEDGATLVVRNVVDPAKPADAAGFARQTIALGGEMQLDRSWQVTPEQKFLVVGVARSGGTPSRIEVRIDGHRAAVIDVPEQRPGGAVQPFLLPLDRFVGRTIHVEFVHLPADDKSLVEWRMLGPVGPLGTQWQPVEIVGTASEGKAKLTRLDDGSILAGGPSPVTDVHSIRLRTNLTGITALRLEPLNDDSLPAGGPGRGPNGGFMLGTVEAVATATGDPDRSRKLVFAKAEATVVESGSPEMIIDQNPKSGWTLTAKSLSRRPAAILVLDQPAGFDGGTEIALTLRCPFGQQFVLGRYRLSVTTDPQPRIGLPGVVLETGSTPVAGR
jgi:hypothetical protein